MHTHQISLTSNLEQNCFCQLVINHIIYSNMMAANTQSFKIN